MVKSAFVTGGSGFIGSRLIELLVDEGWEITALHRPISDLTYLKRFLGELEALKGTKLGMKVVVMNPGDVAGPYATN